MEYSGAHWSVFFLAEYINTFAIAALAVLLFIGGMVGARSFGRLGNHLVLGESLCGDSGNLLGKGHLPPIAHRPAHELRLEGDGAHVFFHHRHNRYLPVLQLARLVIDFDVADRHGVGWLYNSPANGRPGTSGGPGACPAAVATGSRSSRQREFFGCPTVSFDKLRLRRVFNKSLTLGRVG